MINLRDFLGSWSRTYHVSRHVAYVDSQISSVPTEGGFIYKLDYYYNRSDVFAIVNEYPKLEFDIRSILSFLINDLKVKDLTVDGYSMVDTSKLRSIPGVTFSESNIADAQDFGLENFHLLINDRCYLILRDFGQTLELCQGKSLKTVPFDDGLIVLNEKYDTQYEEPKTTPISEAVANSKLLKKAAEYILEKDPDFDGCNGGRYSISFDIESIDTIIDELQQEPSVPDLDMDDPKELLALLKAKPMERFIRKYIELKILNESGYLSKLLDLVLENPELQDLLSLTVLGLLQLLKDEEFCENISPDDIPKMKTILIKSNGDAKKRVCESSEAGKLIFDKDMTAEQIIELLKDEEGGYSIYHMPYECVETLIEYSTEHPIPKLLQTLVYMADSREARDDEQRKANTRKVFELMGKHSGIYSLDDHYYLGSLSELRDSVALRQVQDLQQVLLPFTKSKRNLLRGGQFVPLYELLDSDLSLLIDVEQAKKRIRGGFLHLDVDEALMGRIIGKQGLNIKRVLSELQKQGIDVTKIILHPMSKEKWETHLQEIGEVLSGHKKDRTEAD